MTQLQADWLTSPDILAVLAALEADGERAYFVGGCVRNAVLGAPVSDIDIATRSRPDTVISLAERAGLHAVPTGIKHGTITVVSNGTPVEVTTFRKDVKTDGRRAVVAFSETMEEDALRRDFTMNALYADRQGYIYDPLNGLPDLQARHVRFIENPVQRIREDYLRSLRFFRFHSWYGDASKGFDPEALAAISANLDGLETLSRERVGAEMVKLLAAPDPSQSMASMRMTGVLTRVLPEADDRSLPMLVHHEKNLGLAPDPIRRLAVLGIQNLKGDLRLSRSASQAVTARREATLSDQSATELGYRYGADTAIDALILRAALSGGNVSEDDLQKARYGAKAEFPVRPADLLPHYQGKKLGQALTRLETHWIASGFTLGRDALLDELE